MTPDIHDAELGGYAEIRFADQLGVEGTPWALSERLRPRLEIAPGERLTAEVVVEAALAQGRYLPDEAGELVMASDVGALLEDAGCGYEPAPRYASAADVFSVERLHVDWNLPGVDISVGRQALRWGSGLVFHPSDIYAEVLVTEPWREPRGVNAVKADIPVGDSSVVGVLAVDDDLSGLYGGVDEPADVPVSGAVRATLRAAQTDWSVIGKAGTDGDWFAGADLRGTLGVGWWVEGGWHGEGAAPEVVVGLDYSFLVFERLYVAAEYRYDGTGSKPEDYDYTQRLGAGTLPFDCAFLPKPEGEGRSSLGIHYLDGVLQAKFTEDLGLSTAVVYNLLDGTGILVPDASVLVGDRAEVHLGAQVPFGTDGEYRPSDELLRYEVGSASVDLSGLIPDATLLGWVRYSF